MCFQRDRAVGKQRWRHSEPTGDKCLALHIVLHRVHAIECDDMPSTKVNDGERPRRNVPPHHDIVIADRQADGLQTQVILVRPEPRNGVIRLLFANDVLGGCGRLIVGILNGFQPDPSALGKAVFMPGAVADCVNVRQAGLAQRIDIDAVPALGSRSQQRLDRWHDADADDRPRASLRSL
jgi:hypothetical protein